MSFRIPFKRADDLKAVAPIECWSLEGVRFEGKLLTTVSSSLFFSRGQQTTASAPPSYVLAHPERFDPAGPSPAPAVDAREELAAGNPDYHYLTQQE